MERRAEIDEHFESRQERALDVERAFAFLLGVWDCQGTAAGSHLGAGHAIRSTFELTTGVGGMWIVLRCLEARTPENPDAIEVINHWGLDRTTGRFVRTFHASTGAWGTGHSDGFAGDTLVWSGEIHQSDGRTLPYRQTITRTGPDALREEFAVLEDGSWRVRGELACRRRAQ